MISQYSPPLRAWISLASQSLQQEHLLYVFFFWFVLSDSSLSLMTGKRLSLDLEFLVFRCYLLLPSYLLVDFHIFP